MKTMSVLLLTLASVTNVLSQGTVNFLNSQSTRITNCSNGAPVGSEQGIRAALYYAPDGVTDERAFVPVGASVAVMAGIFSGGSRTIPTPVPGGWVMIQIRAFEAAYGSTYEEAYAAPLRNGRYALTGKSNILRVDTGNQGSTPPEPPTSLVNSGLQGFCVASRPLPFPQITISDALVFEGDSGTTNAIFEVTLIGGSNQVVTVDYSTADNSATAGSDYTATSGTLVFNPGESNKTIAVTVSGDTTPENDEVFVVNLSNPTNGILLKAQAAGTIYNDDCRTDVQLAFYPGVTINGCAGKPYRIEVAFQANPNQWTAVTNFVVPTSPYLWFDTISPISGQRFYRTVLLPP